MLHVYMSTYNRTHYPAQDLKMLSWVFHEVVLYLYLYKFCCLVKITWPKINSLGCFSVVVDLKFTRYTNRLGEVINCVQSSYDL